MYPLLVWLHVMHPCMRYSVLRGLLGLYSGWLAQSPGMILDTPAILSQEQPLDSNQGHTSHHLASG